MENRYKIKEMHTISEEHHNKVHNESKILDLFSTGFVKFSHVDQLVSLGWIEKVEEERIRLSLIHLSGDREMYKSNDTKWTEEQRILCEKAVNGELVEKEKIIEYMRALCHPEKGRGFENFNIQQVADNISCYIREITGEKDWDILESDRPTKENLTTEVPISDCSDETIDLSHNAGAIVIE